MQRSFVDIREGQVHYRAAGARGRPLVMIHNSPGSSRSLVPLLAALARNRRVIAVDTLGNGDSAAPAPLRPNIAYFADAHIRTLDALRLKEVDLYGYGVGASIACEMAIALPDRVGRVLLHDMPACPAADREGLLASSERRILPDSEGTQFQRLWTMVRDAHLFSPWSMRDSAHPRGPDFSSADEMHYEAVELLKAIDTYDLPARADVLYSRSDRLSILPSQKVFIFQFDHSLKKTLATIAMTGRADILEMSENDNLYELIGELLEAD
ncbi:alpha/beta hydrolase [Bosea sp. (in: a-proteobacteria)]|uniref:alpha/beta fold hydrolase n=1 Tax=Bosea sp. (in: a-proteobacteria) TaxID=1871050 RepID=UPI002612DBDE|nr:alpha/beta hydrolase [Bosea sp. (in: a-proteobacteria)]MCO5090586.1 alpha/beta hydrolase [Bosea sp. (in: a-proteobacteria)]